MRPTAQRTETGSAPRLAALVDRVLPDVGLRLRHLPGEVCLASRRAYAPLVEPTPALAREIERCLAGDPGGLSVTRVSPADPRADPPAACDQCGGAASAVRLDLGLGENNGLVIEGLPGSWCWSCGAGVAWNAGREVAERLAGLDSTADGEVVPSLLYETPGHPRSLQIEISTRCNLTCPYCSHHELPEKRSLSLQRFRDLLDRVDLRQVESFDFTGLGEPLLNRELPAMAREVRRRNPTAQIRVVTNGTLLVPQRYEPLCEAGITSVAVSIDSLDPERFARSRRGATLTPVLANLESLAGFRERRGLSYLRLKIKAVLLDDPYGEAERLLAYSARVGLDMPHFSCLDPRQSVAESYREPWLSGGWTGSDDGALLAWAAERWRQLAPDGHGSADPPPGVWPGTAAGGLLNPALLADTTLCRWAVDAAFLTLDGESLSCCETMIDLPRVTWGSLAEATLAELWTGPLLWGYRLPLALGRLPAGCVGCPQAPRHGQPLA
jgi:cyclic pyranopterin phosphate synthase